MEDCSVTPSLNSTQTEQQQQQQQLQHMASTADINGPSFVSEAVGVQNSAAGGNSEATGSEVRLKRKRGRPRKNDGNLPSPKSAPLEFSTSPSSKRGRGRPRGSGMLQMLASMGGMFSATAGGGFIPHVMIVNPGEDVVKNILSFSAKGQRALCILSAIGAVSRVDIQQPDSSGQRCLRYEGFFEMINLSGSYTCGGFGDDKNQTSLAMRISLARSDGTIFGGVVGDSLIAAGFIQLILGSFKQNISNEIKRRLSHGSSGVANMPDADGSDSARLSLQVPKLIESEQSCPSPTSGLLPTSNGLSDHVMPRTCGLPNNVTAATTNGNGFPDFFSQHQSVHSTSMNGTGLDCQVLQQPLTNQMPFGDINNDSFSQM